MQLLLIYEDNKYPNDYCWLLKYKLSIFALDTSAKKLISYWGIHPLPTDFVKKQKEIIYNNENN
ncbi:hypothetical protein HYP07_gp086 [Vibrio phage JSF3]|uniref:hypothetical protein n=1 Tax=Vibrio phage JSF3 TaxID=1916111 RepID=UPI000B61F954|nr:hypothetical protein HYP07_gp086 [Vibrio phage JSF3]APD18098.1 hypothetical protein [Vibrio phage JSF3]